MGGAARRWFGLLPLFDPQSGQTVREPQNDERGWWAGAASAIYDEQSGNFYLYYRLRRPRGVEPDRGAECRIAQSADGVAFTDIWAATKDQFASPSIEKACLLKCLDGRWRLYISYVDPEDLRWRTDVLEADSPAGFDPNKRQKVFTPADVGCEGVKDPYVIIVGHQYYMFLSYAPSPGEVSDELRAQMHSTADVYNTGITKSSSALAISSDGVHFSWVGDVFSPREEGWDAYCARLSSCVWTPPVFTFFYDGSADVSQNYEEIAGLAYTFDLRRFFRVTCDGPIVRSPHGSGSVRYVDVLAVDGRLYYYYEYALPSGAHELRVSVVER